MLPDVIPSAVPVQPAVRPALLSSLRRLRMALAFLLALPVVGTVGYRLLTGAPWLDALYHTIITISTVGYTEHVPIDSPAAKLFTIGLILAAVLITAWAASSVAELLVVEYGLQVWRRQRMQRRIDAMKGHTVVCGYGRMGRRVVTELTAEDAAWVVIERNPVLVEGIVANRGLAVVGDATNDDSLRLAGAERAATLIGVTGDDPENIVITLSARAINPAIRIAVRANRKDSVSKLRLAGADYILDHYDAAATHLVLAVTHPVVEATLGLLLPRQGGLDLGQITITPESQLRGRDLRAIDSGRWGALVIALSHAGRLHCPPPIDMALDAGDVLVVAGPAGALRALREQIGGGAIRG